jgi:riboflavin biosynthesis pyrimidine reductase
VTAQLAEILGTGTEARLVADKLGLNVCLPNEKGRSPVLVVVSDRRTLDSAHELAQHPRVVGFIAWNLDESDVMTLLTLEHPTVVGLPTPDQLRALVWNGEMPVPRGVERDRTARLVALEELLAPVLPGL